VLGRRHVRADPGHVRDDLVEEKVLALVAELVAAVTALIAIATMGPAVIARL
jgi:hypothetical protein